MRFFVKAVATGFAMSMGSALFKKVSKKMGLEDEDASSTQPPPQVGETGTSDELQPEE